MAGKISFSGVVRYILGAFLLLMSLSAFTSHGFIAGLLFFFAAIVTIPSSASLVEKEINVLIPSIAKFFCVFLLVAVAFATFPAPTSVSNPTNNTETIAVSSSANEIQTVNEPNGTQNDIQIETPGSDVATKIETSDESNSTQNDVQIATPDPDIATKIETSDKTLEIDSHNFEVWNNKGTDLYLLGKYEEAIQAYDKALEINPNSAAVWSNKGSALDDLGKHEEAIQAFDKAIEIDPKLSPAWYGKGLTLSVMGKYKEAIQAYDKAIEINPKYDDAWYNKGTTLGRDLGEYEEAIQAFDKAIEINPNYSKAWYNKGMALDELGRHEEAAVCYKMAEDMKR